MNTRIHQEVVYEATPARIYRVLTDAGEFSKLTGGAPTEIDAKVGGAFSLFGGMILGSNIECVPGERLVQAWRSGNWEPGVYSIVRFDLKAEDDGTRVVLEHTGFPEDERENLDTGWHSNYWEPMREMLSAEKS